MKINAKDHQLISTPPTTPRAATLSKSLILLLALACGMAVANVYYAQPLLDAIGAELKIPPASIGLVVSCTQIGYFAGLLLLVPLGDRLDSRRLIAIQSALLALALLAVSLSTSAGILFAAMATVGFTAVIAQTMVALAADRAAENERGRIVGTVTSGIVIGILLARTIAGTLADLAGWRTVYLASAISTGLLSVLLYRKLPPAPITHPTESYPSLLRSMFILFTTERILLLRGILAMLIFAAGTILWTPMVLPLTAAPLSLSHTAVGAFGLAGVAGALGAARAGRMADKGHAQRATAIGLIALLSAWPLIYWGIPHLTLLVAGVIIFDFGLQAVHVTNQSIILKVRQDARSRITGGYMLFYSIGSAAGSFSATTTYAAAGWKGVCLLGTTVSTAALLCWILTLKTTKTTAVNDTRQ